MSEWEKDCTLWWSRVLVGRFAHWCHDWDGLPVDETTPDEIASCHCEWQPVEEQADLDAVRDAARARR